MARYIDADALICEIVNTPFAEGYPYDKEWFDRLQSVIHKVVDMVNDAPTVDEWISVEDRLPKENGEYLVVLGRLNDKWGPSVDLRWFAKDMRKCFSILEKFKRRPGWYFHDGEWGDVEDTTVTFWMPKPQPPKEN